MSNRSTYTPSIPDNLASACDGNMNMAALAARVAAFIRCSESGVAEVSFGTLAGFYGWDVKSVKKYAQILHNRQILVVLTAHGRGVTAKWSRGLLFGTFFENKTTKKCEFYSEENRQKSDEKPPQNGGINKLNKYNYIKEINKENDACGEMLTYKEFYAKFGTDDANEVTARGLFGVWERIPNVLPIKYRRINYGNCN